MISLSRSCVTELFAHLETHYPHEACGVFIGKAGAAGEPAEITAVKAVANLNTERAHDRYEMDPKGQLAAEKEARALGESILGIWHSHPDHPARPSQTDLDRAWPRYAYMIVAIQKGKASEWTTWELDETEKAFRPVVVRVVQ